MTSCSQQPCEEHSIITPILQVRSEGIKRSNNVFKVIQPRSETGIQASESRLFITLISLKKEDNTYEDSDSGLPRWDP